MIRPVLIAGQWKPARATGNFQADDPSTGQPLPDSYPISSWEDCDEALNAATVLHDLPAERLAQFLNRYAARIEERAAEIVDLAHQETALPKSPRLAIIELPRTTNQLRQAAAATLDGSWSLPTIDTKLNIRSRHVGLGPVVVLGPNNFPLAFNGISGGDFAAAIAAGNPVIAKAHPAHPGTTRLLAELALAALADAELPPAMVQMIYHLSPQDGLRLVGDKRVGATAFTGSRTAGLALKAAADAAGKPIYLEMSSLNPVVVLPGALRERAEKIADEFADSSLAAGGQFCTKPGLLLILSSDESESFVNKIRQRFTDRPAATLLTSGVRRSLGTSLKKLVDAGASTLAGGQALEGPVTKFANTLLRVDGDHFLRNPESRCNPRRSGMRHWSSSQKIFNKLELFWKNSTAS